MRNTMIVLILILLTSCSNKSPYCPTLKPFIACDEVKIKTDANGGFGKDDAFELMHCYEEMKYYYSSRDMAYNGLFGRVER